jgi:hypothetical protein
VTTHPAMIHRATTRPAMIHLETTRRTSTRNRA